MNNFRFNAAKLALEARLRMYLADKQTGSVGWGASLDEITKTVLEAAGELDPTSNSALSKVWDEGYHAGESDRAEEYYTITVNPYVE